MIVRHADVVGSASSRLLVIWHPEPPVSEEAVNDLPDDIGDPPSGWCNKACRCGQPCREFDRHRGPCDCGGH